MTSTATMQAKARARAETERLRRPNTASGTDAGYALRLANNLLHAIRSSRIGLFFRLEAMRKFPGFISETPTSAGTEVVWADLDGDLDRLQLRRLAFDKRGKVIRESLDLDPVPVRVSHHALLRLLFVLRTNSRFEVLNAIASLAGQIRPCTEDDIGKHIDEDVPTIGRFQCVGQSYIVDGKRLSAAWLITTIDRLPTPHNVRASA